MVMPGVTTENQEDTKKDDMTHLNVLPKDTESPTTEDLTGSWLFLHLLLKGVFHNNTKDCSERAMKPTFFQNGDLKPSSQPAHPREIMQPACAGASPQWAGVLLPEISRLFLSACSPYMGEQWGAGESTQVRWGRGAGRFIYLSAYK